MRERHVRGRRGGEEADALERAGVACEIVNGITSGLAAASAAGVPLTHRDVAQGVVFVTAHAARRGKTDWTTLVRTRMTLVVYMGVARASAVEAALLAAGLAASTSVLVVENATLPRERQLRTRVGRLARDIADHAISSPAIMVIGEVARADSASDQSKNANVLVSMLSRGGASGGVLGSSNAL